eukprot:359551-Chlamydomonas_euryale.AAC.1
MKEVRKEGCGQGREQHGDCLLAGSWLEYVDARRRRWWLFMQRAYQYGFGCTVPSPCDCAVAAALWLPRMVSLGDPFKSVLPGPRQG